MCPQEEKSTSSEEKPTSQEKDQESQKKDQEKKKIIIKEKEEEKEEEEESFEERPRVHFPPPVLKRTLHKEKILARRQAELPEAKVEPGPEAREKKEEEKGKEPEAPPEEGEKFGWRAMKKKLREFRQLQKKTAEAPGEERGLLIEEAQKLTGTLLKQCWTNIISSWGLTYFYIAFHFIGAYFGGPLADFFCRFGHEWFQELKKAGKAGGKKAKGVIESLASWLEILEIMGCIFLGFLLLITIFVLFLLIYILAHPWVLLPKPLG